MGAPPPQVPKEKIMRGPNGEGSHFQQRVEKGVAWLDEHRPGWEERIVLDELDMDDTCMCVLGFVFGPEDIGYSINESGFAKALYEFHFNEDDAAEMGFDLWWWEGETVDIRKVNFDVLQGYWEAVIQERMSQ